MKAMIKNVLSGVGSIICIDPLNSAISPIKIDGDVSIQEQNDGFQHDWAMVRQDLWAAFQKFEKEHENGSE